MPDKEDYPLSKIAKRGEICFSWANGGVTVSKKWGYILLVLLSTLSPGVTSMQLPIWSKFVLATCATTLIVAAVSLNSIGQETKKADPKAKAGAKEKPKGRLPAYYKDVVTDEQKDQIYAIQAKYDKQIDDLQSQLDAVKAKQNEEIEKLLSAEQLEKLAKVKEEAEAKKKAAKKGGGDKETKSTEPAKTTKEGDKKTK
jgi:hypothetical protein